MPTVRYDHIRFRYLVSRDRNKRRSGADTPLQITGSEQVDAVTLTVNNAASFQIVIPAG
jgi:hypothetical protein